MAAHARRRIPRWTIALPVSLLLCLGGAQAWAMCSTTSDAGAADPVAASSAVGTTTTTTTADGTADDTDTADTDTDTADTDTDTADTDAAGTSTPGTSTSTNTANGVTARFTITDTGSSVRIEGTATGLDPGSSYVSLIYPADDCSNAVPATDATTAGETQAATWENHGDGSATLSASYEGVAYQAVRGRIGSESVREITAIAPSDGTDFSATYAAIDCVPITPRR